MKNKKVAAFLSLLFPGFGHLYIGKYIDAIVFITGAGGVVGHEYLHLFYRQPNVVCVAIARRDIHDLPSGVTLLKLDLLNKEAVAKSLEQISLSDIGEIILVHSVGKFKFEPEGRPEIDTDGDGIDDEVYQTNIETFLNILRSLLPRIEQERQEGRELSLALCGLGSISDKYQVAYWSSYTKAKNVLRSIIYNLIQENPKSVRGLFINVSTVDTDNENELRPFADKTYWLKAKEIANASLPFILGEESGSWKQMDIFKESPLFREGYYQDLAEIRRQWMAQKEGTEKEEMALQKTQQHSEVKVNISDSIQDLFESTRFKYK